jgi:hypothetical protein
VAEVVVVLHYFGDSDFWLQANYKSEVLNVEKSNQTNIKLHQRKLLFYPRKILLKESVVIQRKENHKIARFKEEP